MLKLVGARGNNLKNVDGRDSARHLHLHHRRVGRRQVDARRSTRSTRRWRAGSTARIEHPAPLRPHRGARASRQGHRHRPVADRPHAALEPGDLYRRLHADPRMVRRPARGEGARLSARALLVQRQGRALRGLPGRRRHQDRDALPARRLRHLRRLQGQALRPRDARGEVPRQVDRRRARHDGRGGARPVQGGAVDPREDGDACPRRARLRPCRPAGDDALGRRGAARQALEGTLEARHRPHALHPRRADDGPAFPRRREAARGAARARRAGQHGRGDRAQSRGHQDRRLDHRPRPGRRRRRRQDRGRRARRRTSSRRERAIPAASCATCWSGARRGRRRVGSRRSRTPRRNTFRFAPFAPARPPFAVPASAKRRRGLARRLHARGAQCRQAVHAAAAAKLAIGCRKVPLSRRKCDRVSVPIGGDHE